MSSGSKAGGHEPEFKVWIEEEISSSHPLADRLQLAEPNTDLFQTLAWFQNLSTHGLELTPQRRFVLVEHRRSGRCFGLPLLRQSAVPAAVAGRAVTSMSNFYSSLYGPVGDVSALNVPALRAALRVLAARDGWPGVMDLKPLDDQGPFIGAMEQALAAEGYLTDRYFCFGNWHLPVLTRRYVEYESSLPSRLRNTIKRGRKKLDAEGCWSLQVHRQPGPALDAGIADFEAIYSNSWKIQEPFPQFVPGLCRMAAAQGWLRLGVVRLNDRPIASQLWIVKDGRALIYKLAYDEAYKRLSAGSVLSAELMRLALDEDQVEDVDYLTGDDDYKRDWMSHRRRRVGLVAFRKGSPIGLASLAKHRFGLWLRRMRREAHAVDDQLASGTQA